MIGYRRYREEDVDQIVALMRYHMNIPQYSNEYFHWKFSRKLNHNDEMVRPLGVVAEDVEKVIGFVAFFPYKKSDGSLIWNADDGVVHNEQRNKGVYKGLMNYGLSYLDERNEPSYCFFTSAAYKALLFLGYRKLFELDYFILVPSWAHLLSGKGRTARCIGRSIDIIKKLSKQHFPHTENLDFVKIKTFPDGIDNSILINGHWNSFHKNVEFLNWRFINHPIHVYDCFLVQNGPKTIGYVVFSRSNLIDFGAVDDKYYEEIFIFSGRYFLKESVKVANLFIHVPRNIERMVRRVGYHGWNWNWRPFGFYERHELMLRDPPQVKSSLENIYGQWFFKMADINCGF